MNNLIEQLQNKRLIWRANQQNGFVKGNSTGFKELDQALQGGFPEHGVVDIDTPIGIGELRLLLPALRARQQQHQRLLVFIGAPMQINGEMLAEFGIPLEKVLLVQPQSAEHALWSAEQCLKSGCAHSVLLWHQDLEISQAKRLQLAAEQGDALHFILRHQRQLGLSLPVNLAMKLRPHQQGISVQVTKRKGGWPEAAFNIDMSPIWPQLTLSKDNNNIIPFPQSKVS
ncbi:MAG: translesion DNA synthesis-associated protein ImuA [Aliiglaciecola sp.]|uniref:translesion DNA synthesis-associated protein ImuA n=1 Tax=Aliiglaciecola sp. M165 TaxID=2593649 RepID=UPI0011815677|nr:translesion DNA synthesis-associated protein ImuA [Aliiglaciecola sp. M165]TRY34082.1 translesion DNA synthesis-associated protein ImuA [Aliiglaciecola sp. M165]